MRNTTLLALPAAFALFALGLSAADVWNKDYKQWTDDDVQKILTNSPWAKKTTAVLQSEGGRYGSQGGGGYPSGGGYPGGGGGMGRGGGMGGGFPGGGGMGGGGRRRGGGENPAAEKENVIVRWDSALPVKEALMKQQYGSKLPDANDPGYTLDKPGKDYVITVSGLRMSSRRRTNDDDSSDDSRDSGTDRTRSTLLASTQLMPKGKTPIDPDDVKVTQQSDGSSTAQFFFPRSPEIDLDDKEVTFLTQTGHMKIETKFKLKEMVTDGKLALN